MEILIFDTQITVYDDATGAFIEFNDDFCGLQSKVQFVSNGNPVRVLKTVTAIVPIKVHV